MILKPVKELSVVCFVGAEFEGSMECGGSTESIVYKIENWICVDGGHLSHSLGVEIASGGHCVNHGSRVYFIEHHNV